MRYELYADRIFFFHFCMDAMLLWATASLLELRISRRRLILGAALGALSFPTAFLLPPGHVGVLPVCRILWIAAGNLAGMEAAFGLSNKRSLLNAAVWDTAAACLMGGLLTALDGVLHRSAARILTLSAVTAAGGILFLRRERKKRKNPVCRVRLCKDGREMEITAFWDSGNGLYDPLTHRPVCVAEKAVLDRMGLFARPEKLRVIPYHSIGKDHGMLYAAELDRMYVKRGGQEIEKRHVLIAASEQKLSAQGGCRMLLHPALLEEKKGEKQNYDTQSRDAGKDAV